MGGGSKLCVQIFRREREGTPSFFPSTGFPHHHRQHISLSLSLLPNHPRFNRQEQQISQRTRQNYDSECPSIQLARSFQSLENCDKLIESLFKINSKWLNTLFGSGIVNHPNRAKLQQVCQLTLPLQVFQLCIAAAAGSNLRTRVDIYVINFTYLRTSCILHTVLAARIFPTSYS